MRAVVVHGGAKGLAFARDLIRDGIETYVLHGSHPAFTMAYPGVRPGLGEQFRDDGLQTQYPSPTRAPEEFRRFVVEQLRRIRPDIVFPVNANEITALFPARAEIEAITRRAPAKWKTTRMCLTAVEAMLVHSRSCIASRAMAA